MHIKRSFILLIKVIFTLPREKELFYREKRKLIILCSLDQRKLSLLIVVSLSLSSLTNGQNSCTGWASACIKHQEK